MSVTASQALAALRTQVGTLSFPVYWQGEAAPILADTPALFAFVVFDNDGAGRWPVAFGGGQFNNIYRNRARIEAFIFAPEGEGLTVATDAAETFAAKLRSFRDANISCGGANVIPVGPGSSIAVPGLTSVVSQYQCAVAEVNLHFDTLG